MTQKNQFNVDVFDCTVHVIVSDNIRRSIDYYLRTYGQGKLEDDVSGYFFGPCPEDVSNYFIFFDSEDVTTDVIAHEESHLVEQILIDRDIKPVDEVRAYLTGFISRKIDLIFKRRKLKIRNKR